MVPSCETPCTGSSLAGELPTEQQKDGGECPLGLLTFFFLFCFQSLNPAI